MISSDRSSILAAWTEYRFKKHRFSLSKDFINIICMRIVKLLFFLRFEIFEIIFIFSLWSKNFKRKGCAKVRLLQIARTEITSDRKLTCRCSSKQVILKILLYSQENTYVGALKFFIKKRLQYRHFLWLSRNF